MFDRRAISFRDAGHGYDRFGLHLDAVAMSLRATKFLYERWFRVISCGAEHIPKSGPAILAANHSGMLPLDGVMLWTDVLRHVPRVPRFVADTFVPQLPFVFTAFSRSGVVAGNRATLHRLLDDGELLAIFPEGVPGISKPRAERYRLRPFRIGHAELALRHRAPIVPVAIIGAEEQWPELARIESFHAFGAPHLPIPVLPFPLPVRYRVIYGPPIALPSASADDPATARALASEVRAAVQALVDRGVAEREGIFR
jgi:1-acyl-sn-glycerol-3-phosphate acyltransferase